MESTHFNSQSDALMADIEDKAETKREATVRGSILMSPQYLEKVAQGIVAKGDVLGVARVAGIMGAKRTPELIPLCHILNLTRPTVDSTIKKEGGEIETVCTARTAGKTDMKMEALTGASMALLIVYNMCKAVDKSMEIGDAYLEHKDGGKNGELHNPRCAQSRGWAI